MTLKDFEYINHLIKIYSPICNINKPRPWPNPLTGKPVKQYTFETKNLPELTILHSLFFEWSKVKQRFIKIVPSNIKELLSPIGLGHWIMDDGYWSKGTIYLCTDNFTSKEIDLLIDILYKKFGLVAKKNSQKKNETLIFWRIRFSGKQENLNKLRLLVSSYFIPSMLYKINGNKT